jgi:hypothetical protein
MVFGLSSGGIYMEQIEGIEIAQHCSCKFWDYKVEIKVGAMNILKEKME